MTATAWWARLWSTLRSRGAIRLLLAILAVQLMYWLALHPNLIVKSGKLDRVAVRDAEAAELSAPGDGIQTSTPYAPIELPWNDCCQPGYRAVRMHFDLDAVPDSGLAIVPIVGSDNFRMWVNGSLLFAEGRMELPDITYHGNVRAVFRMPSGVLRSGDNEIRFVLVRDGGSPNFIVGAPIIGDYASMRRAFAVRSFLLNQYNTISFTIGLTLALLAFVVVLRGGDQGVPLWLWVLLLAWSLRLLYYDMTDPPLRDSARMALLYAMVNLLPVAWLNLANAFGRAPLRGVARWSLAAYAALTVVNTLVLEFAWLDGIETVDAWSAWFDLALALGTLLLFLRNLANFDSERILETAMFTLCVSLIAVDAIGGLMGQGSGHVTIAMPLLMLGLAAAFLARNVQLFRSSAQINRLLNARLAEREAELTRTHEQLRQVERAQVLSAERHRMMQDMHDGVGGQLAALLSMSRPGQTDPERMLQAVSDGLTDLRLIIDSLNQIDDDLALALGSLRGRLQPLLDAAGVSLNWRIDSRLSLPGFGPDAILQVYRFVQEAVSNALRHGRPHSITIALEQVDGVTELRIEDDGIGFGQAARSATSGGVGLRAMHERAERLGAQFVREGGEDGGTLVMLRWPARRPSQTDAGTETGSDSMDAC